MRIISFSSLCIIMLRIRAYQFRETKITNSKLVLILLNYWYTKTKMKYIEYLLTIFFKRTLACFQFFFFKTFADNLSKKHLLISQWSFPNRINQCFFALEIKFSTTIFWFCRNIFSVSFLSKKNLWLTYTTLD